MGEVVPYPVLKDFQAGIVGVLGFVGVIITLLWNGHLAKVARLQQINQTRLTIQTALRQELVSIREELENINASFQNGLLEPISFTLEEPYVYRTLVKDIGILEPLQAQTVIRVHRDLYLLINLIRANAADASEPIATMDPKNSPQVAELVTDALNVTNLALSALATYTVVGRRRQRETGRATSGTYSFRNPPPVEPQPDRNSPLARHNRPSNRK